MNPAEKDRRGTTGSGSVGRTRERRTENLRFKVTGEERDEIKRKAKAAGMTVSAFARLALWNKEVNEGPPPDVPKVIVQLRRLEAILERSCRTAEDPERTQIEEALKAAREAEKMYLDAYGI